MPKFLFKLVVPCVAGAAAVLLLKMLLPGPASNLERTGRAAPQAASAPGDAPSSPCTHGIVASVNGAATDAGVDVLRHGGNAIDAAVATALTLGVVDGHNSGIGGGCFMLVRTADGKFFALDGRETAPAKATADMFVRNGRGDPTLSQNGALAVGIPGSLAVYDYALRHFGNKTLAELIMPAADLAQRGFPIDRAYAAKIKSRAQILGDFPASRAILLHPDGSPLREGEILRQDDLAATYRAIAENGINYFYRGAFASAVAQWMKANRGIITASDFSGYEMKLRDPLITGYRGFTIVGFPPPSSGGVHVAEILNILEHFDIAALERKDPALRMHVISEAMKRGFADRAFWLGDPDFVHVPAGLVRADYAAGLAGGISLDHASADVKPGQPPLAQQDYFEKHTTHIAAADSKGNWVALTATVNTAFGSKVIVPGTGVILNDQMDDFAIQPGVANAFGLVGGDANSPGPRKRPLSSMSPTIVLKDGKPVFTVGAAGGPTIISQVVLFVSNVVDLQDDVPHAIGRPRFHHQWSPDELVLEATIDGSMAARLEKLGHHVRTRATFGATQAIARKPDDTFVGASEPRVGGKAAGW